MIHLSVSSNSRQVADQIEKKLERQIPFVTSVALNNTLVKTRNDEVWRDYERVFTARNKAFFRQVAHVYRSKRGQAKTFGAVIGSIQEKMVTPPPGVAPAGGRTADTSFMRRHVSGGVKTPRGASIAIPMTGRVGRKAGGGIRKAQLPRSITGSKRGFRAGKYIMRRKNKKQIEAVYHLAKSAKIRGVWNPHMSVFRGVNSRIRHEFAAAWIRAIKTMR